jgi:hypothetical protein
MFAFAACLEMAGCSKLAAPDGSDDPAPVEAAPAVADAASPGEATPSVANAASPSETTPSFAATASPSEAAPAAPSEPVPALHTPQRPWAYGDSGRFVPDDAQAETEAERDRALVLDAADAELLLAEVKPGPTTPLSFSVKVDVLCEVATVLDRAPHGPLSVKLSGDPSRADASCLARLHPTYLSYGLGPKRTSEEQRAFFALARAVPDLGGLGYDGFGAKPQGKPALTPEDLEDLAALPGLHAVALRNVTIDAATVRALAGTARLRSLDLEGEGVTAERLSVLAGASGLARFACKYCPFGDEGMAQIGKLTQLQVLRIDGAMVTDRGMEHLAGLSDLEVLDLTRSTKVSNAGVAHLAGLTRMKRLWLSTLDIDSGALPHLARLTDLELLHLDRTEIGDENFEVVADKAGLRELNLWSTQVTSAAVAHLAPLKRLETLELTETKIDPAALPVLGKLTSLRDLRLGETELESGFEHLFGLTRLEHLDLRGTSVDHAAARRFATLPHLRFLDLSVTDVPEDLALALETDTLQIGVMGECSG